MNIATPTIIGYNPSDSVLLTRPTEQTKQPTGQTEYDGSKIDNLSLQSGKLISFASQDGNNVKVYIDNSILDKLNSKFGDDSFVSIDNNTLDATGRAGEYLSDFWEVARKNILIADEDRNGVLEKNEILNAKVSPEVGGDINIRQGTMSFSFDGFKSIKDNVFLSEDAKNTIIGHFEPTTVDILFNQLLKYDDNSDGNLNIGELISKDKLNRIYGEFAYSDNLASYEEIQIGKKTVVYKEYMPSAESIKELHKQKLAKQDQNNLQEQDEKEKPEEKATIQSVTQKLLSSNGDESVLSTEEKEALGAELKAIQKRIESTKELQEVKDEVVSKTEETRFLDTVG